MVHNANPKKRGAVVETSAPALKKTMTAVGPTPKGSPNKVVTPADGDVTISASKLSPALELRLGKVTGDAERRVKQFEGLVEKITAMHLLEGPAGEEISSATVAECIRKAAQATMIGKECEKQSEMWERQFKLPDMIAHLPRLQPYKDRIKKGQAELQKKEAEARKVQKDKMEILLKDMPTKCDASLKEIEDLVERTKDETVLLTCELGEHSSAEDILAVDETAAKTANDANDKMQSLSTFLGESDAQLRMAEQENAGPGATDAEKESCAKVLETIKTLKEKSQESREKMAELKKDLLAVKRAIEPHVRKARQEKQKKLREEEALKKKLEHERLMRATKLKNIRAGQIGLYAEWYYKNEKENLIPCQKRLLGLYASLEEDSRSKEASPQSQLKISLTKYKQKIRKWVTLLEEKSREEFLKKQESDEKFRVTLSEQLRSWMLSEKPDCPPESIMENIFQLAAGDGEAEIAYNKLHAFYTENVLKDDDVCKEYFVEWLPSVWKTAVCAKKKRLTKTSEDTEAEITEEEAQRETIGLIEFDLYVANTYLLVLRPTSLTAGGEKGQAGSLDADDVLRVLEIKDGDEEAKKKTLLVERTKDRIQGWVSMPVAGATTHLPSLEAYSQEYAIHTETVLTDTYELKGFKVMRRVLKDEIVIAESLPLVKKANDLLRLKVRAKKDGAIGWITMRGSQGTLFLQNTMVKNTPKARVGNPQLAIQEEEEEGNNAEDAGAAEAGKAEDGKETTTTTGKKMGRIFITMMNEKIYAEDLSSENGEKLTELLKEVAEKAPEHLRNEMAEIEKMKGEEIAADMAAFHELNEEATKTPSRVMDSEFQANVHTKMEGIDKAMKKLKVKVGDLKSSIMGYTVDLRDIVVAPPLLAKVRQEQFPHQEEEKEKKEGEAKKDADGDVEMTEKKEEEKKETTKAEEGPIEGEDDAFVIFKATVAIISKEMEKITDFMKDIVKKKVSVREDLTGKWQTYRKELEEDAMEKALLELQKATVEKLEELKTQQKIVEEKMAVFQGSAEKKEGEKEDAAEASTPAEDKDSFTAYKLAFLRDGINTSMEALEVARSSADAYLKDNMPLKVIQKPSPEGKQLYKSVSQQKRVEIMKKTGVMTDCDNLRQALQQSKTQYENTAKYIKVELDAEIVLRARVEIASYFKNIDCRQVFLNKLALKEPSNASIEEDEKKMINIQILQAYIEENFGEEPVPRAYLDRVYSAIVGNTKRGMTIDEFCNLFCKMWYRVLKQCVMTDIFNIETQKWNKVRRLVPGEIVRLMSPTKKTANGMVRFQAQYLDMNNNTNNNTTSGGDDDANMGEMGWVTLEGNRGAVFFQIFVPGYKVVKQTVLTNIFEMNNFRPVARLNVGDQVRAIGFPRKEGKSGLLRVKATTVNYKGGAEFTGYVTVEGNQSSVYLETCETLNFPDPPTSDEEKPEEKKGEEEKKAEEKATEEKEEKAAEEKGEEEKTEAGKAEEGQENKEDAEDEERPTLIDDAYEGTTKESLMENDVVAEKIGAMDDADMLTTDEQDIDIDQDLDV